MTCWTQDCDKDVVYTYPNGDGSCEEHHTCGNCEEPTDYLMDMDLIGEPACKTCVEVILENRAEDEEIDTRLHRADIWPRVCDKLPYSENMKDVLTENLDDVFNWGAYEFEIGEMDEAVKEVIDHIKCMLKGFKKSKLEETGSDRISVADIRKRCEMCWDGWNYAPCDY